MTEHDLIKTGDKDSFPAIEDCNGDVALAFCRRCRRGEIDLDGPCINPQAFPSAVQLLRDMEMWVTLEVTFKDINAIQFFPRLQAVLAAVDS